MKASELKKLIREEVRKVLREVGNPDLGYGAIEYYMDSDNANASAKYAKENNISNADIVASFQSGEWKPSSFNPMEIINFAKSLKMTKADINTIATALKYSPKSMEQLNSLLSDLTGEMTRVLKPLIGDVLGKMIEQYDEFKVRQSLVNIEITPRKGKDAEIFSILEKNKNKLSSFLQTNGLPSCKLFYGTSDGKPKIVITSKPKPTSYIKASKEIQL